MAAIYSCGEQVFSTIEKKKIKELVFFYNKASKICKKLLEEVVERNLPVKLEETSGRSWFTGTSISVGIESLSSQDLQLVEPPILMVWYLDLKEDFHQVVFLTKVKSIEKVFALYHFK